MLVPMKLPDGLSDDEEGRKKFELRYYRCFLIRSQYLISRAKYNSVLSGNVIPDVSGMDNPSGGNKNCVWYDILARSWGLFNPLLAIKTDFEDVVETRETLLPNLITKRVGKQDIPVVDGRLICDPSRKEHYLDQAREQGLFQRSRALSTITALTMSVDAVADLYGITDPAMILSTLKQQTKLDPVLELYWRTCRNLETSEHLKTEAQIAAACSFWLYGNFPRDWLSTNKLFNVFRVCNGIECVPPVGIAGLCPD